MAHTGDTIKSRLFWPRLNNWDAPTLSVYICRVIAPQDIVYCFDLVGYFWCQLCRFGCRWVGARGGLSSFPCPKKNGHGQNPVAATALERSGTFAYLQFMQVLGLDAASGPYARLFSNVPEQS